MARHTIFIADRSSSMSTILQPAIDGYNFFVETQKRQPGESYLTLIMFSDVSEYPFTKLPIAQVARMTKSGWRPRGGTAIRDAVGLAIDTHKHSFSPTDTVLVILSTDGYENASHKYSETKVREATSWALEHGWQFSIQGANVDAEEMARMLGLPSESGQNFEYTAAGVAKSFKTLTRQVLSMRAIP